MARTHLHRCSEILELVHSAKELLQSEKPILASLEDCNYFRNYYRIQKESPNPESKLPPAVIPQNPLPLNLGSAQEIPVPPILSNASSPVQKSDPQPSPIHAAEDPKKMPSLPSVREAEKPEAQSIEPPVKDLPQKRTFSLEDQTAAFAEIRKILSKLFPEMPLLKEIPSDSKAKQIAESWKTKNQASPISILSFHEPAAQSQFLSNLTQALDITFGHARLISAEEIEQKDQWEAFLSVPELKFLMICDYALWQMPRLLKFYREIPSKTERYLLNTPIMLLPDLSLYLKDSQLKRSLWKALCLKIQSL